MLHLWQSHKITCLWSNWPHRIFFNESLAQVTFLRRSALYLVGLSFVFDLQFGCKACFFFLRAWLFWGVRNESRTVAVWRSVCQRFICMRKYPFIILNGNRTICLALHYFLNSSWLALFSNVYVAQLRAAFNKSPLVCSNTGENYHRLSILEEHFKAVTRTKFLLSFTPPSCHFKPVWLWNKNFFNSFCPYN